MVHDHEKCEIRAGSTGGIIFEEEREKKTEGFNCLRDAKMKCDECREESFLFENDPAEGPERDRCIAEETANHGTWLLEEPEYLLA